MLPGYSNERTKMQTDTISAWQLSNGDYFVEQGEVYKVKSLDRDDDWMDFTVIEVATEDEYPMTFAPFDEVILVTSFDEEFEFEDVEI